MPDFILVPVIVAVVVVALLIFITIGYVKAPPDMAYIISGFKKNAKIVI